MICYWIIWARIILTAIKIICFVPMRLRQNVFMIFLRLWTKPIPKIFASSTTLLFYRCIRVLLTKKTKFPATPITKFLSDIINSASKTVIRKSKILRLKNWPRFQWAIMWRILTTELGNLADCKKFRLKAKRRKPSSWCMLITTLCMWVFIRYTKFQNTTAKTEHRPKYTN